MTDKKISDLDVAIDTGVDDVQPIVQEGVTKQISNLLANHTLINVARSQISAMAMRIGNISGRVGLSGIEFWYNGVKQSAPDSVYLMYRELSGGFSNSDPLVTNLVGALTNLTDDDSGTCVKYDCTFVNDLDNPQREDYYFYFIWPTAQPFFDEIRVIAAAGADYDVDETPERIVLYTDGDFLLENFVAQFYVDDPSTALSWSDGETKSFATPNYYIAKQISNVGYYADPINVGGANGEYITTTISNLNEVLLSGDIIVHPAKTTFINSLRKQQSFIDSNTTFNEAYVLDGNGPAPIYFVDTAGGDVTITFQPPSALLARVNLTYDNAEMRFINTGNNDLLIANSGFVHFIHKGTCSTPHGGQLTVFIANDYLTVTGDTT